MNSDPLVKFCLKWGIFAMPKWPVAKGKMGKSWFQRSMFKQ